MARTGASGATGDQDVDKAPADVDEEAAQAAAEDKDVAAVDEAMAPGAVDVVPAPPTNMDEAVAAEPDMDWATKNSCKELYLFILVYW